MRTIPDGLAAFGWSNFFQSQLSVGDVAGCVPARVLAVHRSRLEIAGPAFNESIKPLPPDDSDQNRAATVGDWLLLDRATRRPTRLLERKSLFRRKAAGMPPRVQLVAANVDTLMIVTSCNEDFNAARLERYLALAREAGVMPIVLITKADLAGDPDGYRREAAKLAPALLAECLDARDPACAAVLAPWCGVGQTVALVGSSGVGKSTLLNTLLGNGEQETAPIREDDAKGRHTTTSRSMHRLKAGGWLIDTPGMRELQLADAGEGVDDVFGDMVELGRACRFGDCLHATEPGCAVLAAVEDGRLDPERLRRFRKLHAEDARNSAAIHERHAAVRRFGRMVKAAMKEKDARRGK